MIVKTKLAEQAEQFELEGSHYVGRRVLYIAGTANDPRDHDSWELVRRPVCHAGVKYSMTLFELDYDRGQVFVDPAILRPYQRPERLEKEAGK